MNLALMRFCPSCQTERDLSEIFCQGSVQGRLCDWDLSAETMHPSGWRPQPVVTSAETGQHALGEAAVAAQRICVNGHPLGDGDLMCATCGAEPDGQDPAIETAPPAPVIASDETQIDGWRLVREISSTDGVRSRYVAERIEDKHQAILTLYRAGFEPDPAVYDVLRRLPREHVPEIIATGRWDERAYEIAEELTGGTLAELGIVIGDLSAVRHIVRELGEALHSFSEAGLRHRDIRPGTLLVRSRDPLDLVISGFGSARLSEFDLDIVSPLEISRYMAPEAIAGGVAAASDWWSLGMVLLEQITDGSCFKGVNPNAYLIHVLANGVQLPDSLNPEINLLLRGLLARDRHHRWQWSQVNAWLNGEAVSAPEQPILEPVAEADGASIVLGSRHFRNPSAFALAAADPQHWPQAQDHLLRGVIITWAQNIGVSERHLAGLRQVIKNQELSDDLRLMLALKLLNPEMPLIYRGQIVTPGWLLDNPLEGYELISGPAPDMLVQLETEPWLSRLKVRAEQVRQRANHQKIDLDENQLRIYLLSSSRARLAAQWQERQQLLPDSEHHGLQSLSERRVLAEEDLIVLLSAEISQFRSIDALLAEAAQLASRHGVAQFNLEQARTRLQRPRQELYAELDDRILGFAHCNVPDLDRWADQFRLDRRLSLVKVLVLLGLPVEQWIEPQKQQYATQILAFFEKKVAGAVLRGPLVRMTIGKTTARIDLNELDTSRSPSGALLDHLLQRNAQAVHLDPSSFTIEPARERRLRGLHSHSTLYRRDTGIDGLYLGFPFLLVRDPRGNTRTRIAPILLWPVKLLMEVGSRGQVGLAFDSEREEVRINPALDSLLGTEASRAWRKAADDVLQRSALRAADVMDAFGMLATVRGRVLGNLPSATVEISAYQNELACAAVLFHVTFMGQAIGEDLRQLKALSPGGTGLETALRLNSIPDSSSAVLDHTSELNRFFTVASDPSQEAAVLLARRAPGLLVEGPPGTGKSQTIVNMVGDAIGRQRSVLIVCQKHAALEVVRKRLAAEGLGDRLVMIDDVNRDRESVIRSIREQLERLFRSNPDLHGVQRQRERLAVRIESLEGELDRFHQGLHAVDQPSGLSYRELLGELIELESGTPPLEMPELRQRVAALDITNLARLEETCAPLIRHWLPAQFEGSPYAQLRPFSSDRSTLESFKSSLNGFMEAEESRVATLQAHPATFEIDDPTPYRAWMEQHVATLLSLNPTQRQLLARWLPMFRSSTVAAGGTGEQIQSRMKKAQAGLQQCNQLAYSPILSSALSGLGSRDVQLLELQVVRVLATKSWVARLNPMHHLRRRKVLRFLTESGDQIGEPGLPALLAAAQLESQWRPWRSELADLMSILGLPSVPPDSGLQLLPQATKALQQLDEIQVLAQALAHAPRAQQADAAALAGDRIAFEALVAELEAALIRHNVRERSLAMLHRLKEWIDEDLYATFRAHILINQANTIKLNRLRESLPHLAAYQQFRIRASSLAPEDLELLASLREQQSQLEALPLDQLDGEVRRLLNREARLGWKRRIEHENQNLLLDAADSAQKISNLAAADAAMRKLNRELLSNGIDTSALGTRKQWEDVTRLTGRRSRRLREFIELGAPLGLMGLRPVWLMNPDVASRVLPLKAGLFDIVIYDEASQMPVEFALPTLYRGRITIVSGDEKQMPPTAFFASRVESDEAELFDGNDPEDDADEAAREDFEDTWNRREIKDCPDLLQLARSVLPVTTLQIHYRSAYRELINFSNAAFYGDDLSVPVRHPKANVLSAKPLELRQVGGLYLNQTNETEALHVVDYLATLWRTPYAQRSSVGVVTFNRKQADLIEERLELRAEEDDGFRAAYSEERERMQEGEDMSVFVKNVENVQGDERDIIVFSSTFGRNGQGTFRRNFGVLGQKGGERRLNVAVTRARQKVVMITSMPIAAISDMLETQRSPASPRDYLQGYLEYARAISVGEFPVGQSLLRRLLVERNRTVTSHAGKPDGFSNAVAAYIESLGWTATKADDGDAFGLDFAIESPDTGLYAIGIECDTPRHSLLARARSREIWRPSVLRRAISHLHRVSSQGWYQNADRERMLLRTAIEQAMLGISRTSDGHSLSALDLIVPDRTPQQ